MGNETNQRKDEKLFILIISCLREPNFYRKLHLAYLLTFNIDDELGKKYDLEKFQKNIHDLLVDTNFLRAVHHRESIIMEDGHICLDDLFGSFMTLGYNAPDFIIN